MPDTTAARSYVKENDAVLVEASDYAFLPDGALARKWEKVRKDEVDAVVRYLQDYTSSANTTRKAYVDDPMVNGKVLNGRWRGGFVRVRPNEESRGSWDVIQELYEGLLTSLDFEHARLAESEHLTEDANADNTKQHYITLRWVGVDPEVIYSLSAGKNGKDAFADIAIRKWSDPDNTITLAGNWYHLRSRGVLAEDGSGTVEWRLSLDSIFELEAVANKLTSNETDVLYLWNIPQGRLDAITSLYEQEGYSFTASKGAEPGLFDVVVRYRSQDGVTISDFPLERSCMRHRDGTFWFGVSQSYAQSLALPAHEDGVTYSRQFFDRRDGTFDVILTKTTSIYKDQAEFDSFENADRKTVTKRDHNVTTQTIDVETDVDGKQVDVEKRINPDCSIDIEKRTTEPKSQSRTTVEESPGHTTTTSVSTEADNALSAPAVEQGKVIEHRNAPTAFGKTQTTVTTRQSKNQSSSSVQKSEAVTENTDVETAAAAEAQIDGQAGTENFDGSVRNTVNDDGTYQTVSVLREHHEQLTAEYVTRRNAAESVSQKRGENVTEADSNATSAGQAYDMVQEAGKIKRLIKRENDHGTYSIEYEVADVSNQSATGSSDSATLSESVEVNTNIDAVPQAIDSEGVVQRVTANPTASGKFNVSKTTATSKEQHCVEYDYRVTADFTIKRVIGRNIREVNVLVGAGQVYDMTRVDGKTKTLDKTRNADDTFDIVYTVSEVLSRGFASMYLRATGLCETRTVNTNATAPLGPPATVPGHRITHRTTETEHGYRTEIIDVEFKPTSNDETQVDYARRVARVGENHAVAPVAAPSQEIGKTNRSVNRETDVGTYDVLTEAVEYFNQTAKTFSETHESSVVEELHTEGTEETAAPAISAGVVVDVMQRPTPGGKVEKRTRTTTSKDNGVLAYDSVKTPQYTETREVINGATSAPSLTEAYGSLQYRKRSDGLFDGIKTVRTYVGNWSSKPSFQTYSINFTAKNKLGYDVKIQQEAVLDNDTALRNWVSDGTEPPNAVSVPGAGQAGFVKIVSDSGYTTGIQKVNGGYIGTRVFIEKAINQTSWTRPKA